MELLANGLALGTEETAKHQLGCVRDYQRRKIALDELGGCLHWLLLDKHQLVSGCSPAVKVLLYLRIRNDGYYPQIHRALDDLCVFTLVLLVTRNDQGNNVEQVLLESGELKIVEDFN